MIQADFPWFECGLDWKVRGGLIAGALASGWWGIDGLRGKNLGDDKEDGEE